MKYFLFLFLFCLQSLSAQDVLLHSHNDYLQQFPLQTALKFQANSIEVDVAWFQNEIRVSHFNFFLKEKPLFEELYLEKMLAQKDQLGSVRFLMIDIKSGGEAILLALNEMISEYNEIFASRTETDAKKIRVVVSGAANRQALVKSENLNYLFADGKPNNLEANINSWLMPFVSSNFAKMKNNERVLFIEKAQKQDKLVRFWNTRDNFSSWEMLLDLKVDIIGVDHLEKFQTFLELRK